MLTQPRDNLVAWLRDAYALESQAIQLAERQIQRLEHYPDLRGKLQEHLSQTRGQQAALEQAFALLDSDLSALKAGVMKVAANVQGMMHALASYEVMKHILANYAFAFRSREISGPGDGRRAGWRARGREHVRDHPARGAGDGGMALGAPAAAHAAVSAAVSVGYRRQALNSR